MSFKRVRATSSAAGAVDNCASLYGVGGWGTDGLAAPDACV